MGYFRIRELTRYLFNKDFAGTPFCFIFVRDTNYIFSYIILYNMGRREKRNDLHIKKSKFALYQDRLKNNPNVENDDYPTEMNEQLIYSFRSNK